MHAIINVVKEGTSEVSLLCKDSKGKRARILVKNVMNEICLFPVDTSPNGCSSLEKEVQQVLGPQLKHPKDKETMEWSTRIDCFGKDPAQRGVPQRALIIYLEYSRSLKALGLDNAKKVHRRFGSPVEAFILLAKIRGSTMVRIDQLTDQNTCEMSNIHMLGYSMPVLRCAYIYTPEHSSSESISVAVYERNSLKEQNNQNTHLLSPISTCTTNLASTAGITITDITVTTNSIISNTEEPTHITSTTNNQNIHLTNRTNKETETTKETESKDKISQETQMTNVSSSQKGNQDNGYLRKSTSSLDNCHKKEKIDQESNENNQFISPIHLLQPENNNDKLLFCCTITRETIPGTSAKELESNCIYTSSTKEDTINKLSEILDKYEVDLVISCGITSTSILRTEWKNTILFCNLPRFIESVNRFSEYSLSELIKGYKVDLRTVPMTGSITAITTASKALTSIDIIPDQITELNSLRLAVLTMNEIVRNGSILELAEKLSLITGAGLNSIFNGFKSDRVEYLLMHTMVSQGYLIPPRQDKGTAIDDNSTYEGGYVFLESTGAYLDSYIALFDFNSLYPSIIREYNVCFSTVDRLSQENIPQTKTFLPETVTRLVDQRTEIRKRMKGAEKSLLPILEVEQKAVKLVANCIYGCLGFKGFRFYNRTMASFITECGRSILKRTKQKVEEAGYSVIYGDTDSVMINTNIPTDHTPPTDQFLNQLSQRVNSEYKHIVLGFEKTFKKLVMLAKKKYFGVFLSGTEERIEEKGLETNRRDWAPAASTIAAEVLRILLYSTDPQKDIVTKLKETRNTLQSTETPKEQFVLRKKIAKNPMEYASTQAQSLPQVSLALRLMKEKGLIFSSGSIISFVMAVYQGTSRPELLSETSPIDIEYYISMQVLPPVQRMIEPFPSISLNEIKQALGLKVSNTFISSRQTVNTLDKTIQMNDSLESTIKRVNTLSKTNTISLTDNSEVYIPKTALEQSVPLIITEDKESSNGYTPLMVNNLISIRSECCQKKQILSSRCSECLKEFSNIFLRDSLKSSLFKLTSALYSIKRICSSCSKSNPILDHCLECSKPTTVQNMPTDLFHRTLTSLSSRLSNTPFESLITSRIDRSNYLTIDLSTISLNPFSIQMYIPSLINRPDLLDQYFL
ncbi:DNA polymerase alpha subunit A [Nematocida sp. AWRm80]|nr:DNA polymerase alpha subunit A [Nematocida sp. AWRm80]